MIKKKHWGVIAGGGGRAGGVGGAGAEEWTAASF